MSRSALRKEGQEKGRKGKGLLEIGVAKILRKRGKNVLVYETWAVRKRKGAQEGKYHGPMYAVVRP